MKIMQVLPRMDLGGVERGVVDLAKHFKDKQDEIIVVSGGGRLVKELESLGVKHYKLDVYSKSLISLLAIKRLRSIIDSEGVDIVHARSRVPAWISFFATRGSRAHFITTAHGFYSVHFFSRIMACGKFVICPSKVIARHMQTNFGLDSDKIVIINRWVDLDKFRFSEYQARPENISIISSGRIAPSKGYEYLIEAMRRIARTNPYVNLNIVGTAEESRIRYLNSLKSLVNRYSLSYNVKFLGYRKDVEKLLGESHILVVPSVVEESFGRVIVEAFACGVPVIASRIGAMAEIIEDGKDGILVPPRDHVELSKAILRLLNNSALTKEISINARKKVESFYSSVSCISKIEQVYKNTQQLRRVMVIKISSLGDIVLAIPSLRAIKGNFPKAELTLLTLKKYTSLFHNCPYVDKIIGLDDDYKKLSSIGRISSQLRRQSFDYVIDLQNSRISHVFSFLSFARKSFGYRRKLGFLLSSGVRYSKATISPLESQEKVLDLLGIKLEQKQLTLWPVKKVSLEHLGISDQDKLIGINVSASRRWETKNWPVSHTRKFIELITKELPHFKIVLIGDQQSLGTAKAIGLSFGSRLINICGKTTLKDLVELISQLKLFVCQDTAPLHLASALGISTIALFGPTDPKRHTVAAKNLHIVYKRLSCSFCYKPVCKPNICMEKISPQGIFVKAKAILSR